MLLLMEFVPLESAHAEIEGTIKNAMASVIGKKLLRMTHLLLIEEHRRSVASVTKIFNESLVFKMSGS